MIILVREPSKIYASQCVQHTTLNLRCMRVIHFFKTTGKLIRILFKDLGEDTKLWSLQSVVFKLIYRRYEKKTTAPNIAFL